MLAPAAFRHSAHLRQMRRARAPIETALARAVYRELRWVWNRLYPRLRHLAAHRRRAVGNPHATRTPANPSGGRSPRRGAGELWAGRNLIKAFDFANTTELWQIFATRLEARILAELATGALTLGMIEQAYWAARGEVINTAPEQIVNLYQAEIGRRGGREIVGVSDTTRRQVGEAVADWYKTPGSTLGDLVAKLQPVFGEARARNIAVNETTWLNSAVTLNSMTTLGINKWSWQSMRDEVTCVKELTGPDGNTYAGCRELHGQVFDVSEDMPPEGSHIGCRCGVTPIVSSQASPGGI